MKLILKKLRDMGGASMILALLFLLLCMMVGASVLAAASSNAGKIKSMKEEQQRYFAVSSALQLVAGRLEKAEYKAKTTVAEVTVKPKEPPAPDPDNPYEGPGSEVYEKYMQYLADLDDPRKNYTYTIYRQDPGEFKFDFTGFGDSDKAAMENAWKGILPLDGGLDWLFAQTFPGNATGFSAGNDKYIPRTAGVWDPDATPKILTVKPEGLPDDALEALDKNVYVTVRIGKSDKDGYRIFLTAELRESDDPGAKMLMALKTELVPETVLPHIHNQGVPDSSSSLTVTDPACYPAADTGLVHTEVTEHFMYEVTWKRGLTERIEKE